MSALSTQVFRTPCGASSCSRRQLPANEEPKVCLSSSGGGRRDSNHRSLSRNALLFSGGAGDASGRKRAEPQRALGAPVPPSQPGDKGDNKGLAVAGGPKVQIHLPPGERWKAANPDSRQ